jgi:hypothetical protein
VNLHSPWNTSYGVHANLTLGTPYQHCYADTGACYNACYNENMLYCELQLPAEATQKGHSKRTT